MVAFHCLEQLRIQLQVLVTVSRPIARDGRRIVLQIGHIGRLPKASRESAAMEESVVSASRSTQRWKDGGCLPKEMCLWYVRLNTTIFT